jgi:uncharacterized protein (TIGR02596 family)
MKNNLRLLPGDRLSTGFSLIELLGVITIIGLLAALMAPAFTTLGGGQRVSAAADMVAGNLDLARQTAMSENQRTEFRIWKLPDPTGSGTSWNALQIFRVDNGAPLSQLSRLPQGVVLIEKDPFSTVLGTENPYTGTATNQRVARTYKAVKFGPDGSTELSPSGPGGSGTWTLTVVPANSQPSTLRPAANFATIQIDPITGRSLTYRP